MPNPTRNEITAFQEAVAALEASADAEVYFALQQLDLTTDEGWELAELLLQSLLPSYGTMAHALGSRFYELCRGEPAGMAYDHAQALTAASEIVGSARAKVAEGRVVDPAQAVAARAGQHVQSANREAVLDGIRSEHQRHHGRKVGYARVPRPDCSCAFCITMAGRGFTYWTEATAGGGDPANCFHDNCRCTVVPMDASDTLIEGYDETEYEAMYEAARDALNHNELPHEVYDRIAAAAAKAEAEGRKWRSLNEIEIAMRHMYGMH